MAPPPPMRLALFGILLTGAVVFYFMVLLSSKSSYQEWEANELLLRPSVTSLPLGDVQQLARCDDLVEAAQWERAMRFGQIRSIRVFQAGLADKFQISLSIEQEEGDEDDEAQEEHREDVEEHEDALALDQDIDIDDEAREMDGLDHDDVNKLERQRQRRSAQNNKNNKQRDGISSSNNNKKKKKRRSIKSYLVALKPVSIPLMFDTEWPTTPVLNADLSDTFEPKRADRVIQGWSEIATYHIDRLLRFNRKPPTVGRKIPSYLIQTALANDNSNWKTRFIWSFADDTTEVMLQGWLRNITISPPSLDVYQALTFPETKARLRVLNASGDISDQIVFDYLVDDHDRHRNHNWVLDSHRRLINWDSGLAFNHGPTGRQTCLDLLCGPDPWKDFGRTTLHVSPYQCKKICRFRNSTITRLRELSTDNPDPSQWLSAQLEKRMKVDELFPVFQHNLYYPYLRRFPKVRFDPFEFFKGMDRKVSRFLVHVDSCIRLYSEDVVLSL